MGAVVGSQIHVSASNPAYTEQFVSGYHHALYVAAAIALAGALVAVAMVRKVRHREAAEAAEAADGGYREEHSAAPCRRPSARVALIDAALRVFASGSYSGATTAEIAREARVSEPILYRHFAIASATCTSPV